MGERGRLPALDGLRGVAILGVVSYHAGYLRGGGIGVAVFFALSGYLVTGVLLRRPPDVWQFYLRRTVRIGPALLPVLAFLLAVGRSMPEMGSDHLWSLILEETFYLAWPVLVALTGSRRAVFRLALALAVTVMTWRVVVMAGVVPYALNHYRSPDTRFDALLLGAALASAPRLPRVSRNLAAFSIATVVASFFLPWTGGEVPSMLVVLPVITIAALMLVAHAASHGDSALRVLQARWLRWTGEVSYGLYLWHIPIMLLFPAHHSWSLPVALTVAALSWYGIERPVLRLHRRLAAGGHNGDLAHVDIIAKRVATTHGHAALP